MRFSLHLASTGEVVKVQIAAQQLLAFTITLKQVSVQVLTSCSVAYVKVSYMYARSVKNYIL